ncbi:cysteine dioxygenase [Bradyrhizobium ontarionense]|uniref:Cysteine dioxygenase n=1 Tax=Bradyrhizobium ontarionense TaxID=2898149 RepID=A0ABY3RLM7_9BRAD|nr:cysteine dioxygenase [Bradyrhizobium sp. A19]UFZ07514.1 cysteine dioxygenase [Bradyrhizobium sp. A19]
MTDIARLRDFVAETARLVASTTSEAVLLAALAPKLEELVAHDDWLPEAYAVADGGRYRQYLLYADPLERFSIVSFVWGPGQGTPIHDHRVWGLVGVLRGEELSVSHARQPDGTLHAAPPERLRAGQTAAVSPQIGDIHAISNGLADRSSISIHVYGGNIGRIRRAVYDSETGTAKDFISGYSNDTVPNLWPDRGAA